MNSKRVIGTGVAAAILAVIALPAGAQSFRVQCPIHTTLHPLVNAAGQAGKPDSTLPNPHIKCQQVSGGDGFATMGDGTQTYMFSFGPLSGLADIVNGLPGTQAASVFNQNNLDANGNVLDVVKIGAPDGTSYPFNGAIGLVPDVDAQNGNIPSQPTDPTNPDSALTPAAWAQKNALLTGHVDPRLIMDVGVLNGNIPAPMIAIDEGDELFLTLTNVGMVMRPDLFEQHTIHFHGYPNASAFYDGVPDASVAINIGGSFTYYYLAPEAGTYMWHCHISPPEHLQMGMVGQLYVRPRQSSLAPGSQLYARALADQSDVNTKCAAADLLCSVQLPPSNGVMAEATKKYAYDDGDGSTAYDVEYPIQMHGFDPNFHFVGMTFNPESFADNKDKYFLLNGRSYPDTINPDPLSTQASDGTPHFSQPLPTVINIPSGGRALLRFSDLNVTEFHTLASLGIKMHVIGFNGRLLRDQDGNNMSYFTNSITLGGGETIDVILDACMARGADGACPAGVAPGQTFYLYTPQLDHLSNDAENFGGMMTEVNVCRSVNPITKKCG